MLALGLNSIPKWEGQCRTVTRGGMDLRVRWVQLSNDSRQKRKYTSHWGRCGRESVTFEPKTWRGKGGGGKRYVKREQQKNEGTSWK